jgi:hypothetical protein
MFGLVQEVVSMIRHAAAVVVALCLSTSPLYGQTLQLTVSAASASVHKAPSVASLVIGQAPRGTALVVTREVGDWVKVSWPSAQDGIGYVRVAAGSLARNTPAPAATTATTASRAAVAPAAPLTSAPVPARLEQASTPRASAPSPARTLYVAPTHIVGVGVMAGGSAAGFGASTRAWSQRRLGAQLEVSRYSINSIDMLSRASSTDIAPSILFAMRDHVTDYLWLRPYVGLGAHIGHSSRTDLIFTDVTESSNTLGARVFAGGELAFASLPHFALSMDVGYYRLPRPFDGFEAGGMGLAVSGHWYLK